VFVRRIPLPVKVTITVAFLLVFEYSNVPVVAMTYSAAMMTSGVTEMEGVKGFYCLMC